MTSAVDWALKANDLSIYLVVSENGMGISERGNGTVAVNRSIHDTVSEAD